MSKNVSTPYTLLLLLASAIVFLDAAFPAAKKPAKRPYSPPPPVFLKYDVIPDGTELVEISAFKGEVTWGVWQEVPRIEFLELENAERLTIAYSPSEVEHPPEASAIRLKSGELNQRPVITYKKRPVPQTP